MKGTTHFLNDMEPINVRLQHLVRLVLIIAITIVLVHSLSWLAHYSGHERIKTFRLLFNLSGEGNIAAYFSALLILLVSLCSWLLYRTTLNKRLKKGWLLTSGLFFFLSWDEASQIHEKFNKSFHALLGGGDQGIFNFAWVIPYSVLVVLVGLVLIPFIRVLPRKLFIKLAFAGIVYVMGAIGMEMISATIEYKSSWYMLVTSIEESMEITGMILFLYFLTKELGESTPEVELRFVK